MPPNGAGKVFFRPIQTLPAFWATWIWTLRTLVFEFFWIPNFWISGFPDFQNLARAAPWALGWSCFVLYVYSYRGKHLWSTPFHFSCLPNSPREAFPFPSKVLSTVSWLFLLLHNSELAMEQLFLRITQLSTVQAFMGCTNEVVSGVCRIHWFNT